jgi:hypothetical protein
LSVPPSSSVDDGLWRWPVAVPLSLERRVMVY